MCLALATSGEPESAAEEAFDTDTPADPPPESSVGSSSSVEAGAASGSDPHAALMSELRALLMDAAELTEWFPCAQVGFGFVQWG